MGLAFRSILFSLTRPLFSPVTTCTEGKPFRRKAQQLSGQTRSPEIKAPDLVQTQAIVTVWPAASIC
jgi:hypothetical protein